MVKKSLVWLYSVTTFLLWAVIIVVASVVLALRYYVLPHAQDYRDDIAQYVSQSVGQRIVIGDIKAGWSGLNPYFDLYQIDLYDAQGRPALSLDHVETSLSWFSLILGEPRLARLDIHHPSLLIRRAADGSVFIAGISLNAPGESAFPNWLLRQSSIRVDNATVVWQDELRKAPPLALNKLSLNISSPPWEALLGHHRFGLRATPSAGSSAPIDLRGNVWGKNVSHIREWRGTLYAKLEGTDIAAWKGWVDYPVDLAQGSGATQFWLDFADGRTDKITADLLFANVHTRLGKNMPVTALQALSGRMTWKRLDDGHELHGDNIKLSAADGFNMKQGQLRLESRMRNGKEMLQGEAALDEVGLEQFAAFAANLPLGKELQEQLIGFAPVGRLENAKFSWQGDRGAIRRYSLRSRFAGLGISPVRGIPGFSGLSGDLTATESGGTLTIAAKNAQLNLQEVLRWPIPADKLDGHVTWKTGNGATEVQVNDLAIANPHLSGKLNASYRYDGKKGGYLDLKGKFGNANGRYASFYYPLLLGKDTLDWLDRSIVKAHGEDINVVVKGYLDDFPYPGNKNGEFKVSARITDGALDYADAWPKIDAIQLAMLFHGDRMDLTVEQGRIFGGQIVRGAKVSIPALDAERPVVQIQGEVQAAAADALKFVNASPVAEAIDHFTDGMQAGGAGRVQLDINLPIDNPELTKVKGSYTVNNGTLSGGKDFPALDRINGKLLFTEASLRAQNLAAYIYGGPAQFSLETGSSGQLKVSAMGHINETGLRQAFDHPLLQKMHGSTDWNADINLHEHLTDISIHSQLTGLSVSLPPPFSKAAADSVPFSLDIQQKTPEQSLLSASYGSVVSAKLLRNDNKGVQTAERGEINFGGKAELPAQRGIAVNGKLAQLDWDLWSELMDRPGARQPAAEPEIASANLDIGTLDIFDRRINSLNLAAKSAADGWTAKLQSKEITGDVRWLSAGKGKVLARLKALTIPGPAPAKMSVPNGDDKTREYPALDITAENFEAKNKKLGRLELLAEQQGLDWNIEKLKLSNPDGTLSLDGVWQSWRRHPNTSLNINWDIDDLGKTLERFGYPDTIRGGSATLSGRLRWPGSPHEFSLPGLGGNLTLEAKRGQFLKIQPGVGRLLGVVSLQALPRRLLFDFRDVFNEGFAFDLVGGDLQIRQGVMKSDDFRMEGPAAKVAISGETNLERETLNLHVKVSPAISDSLSLAAFAGGPAVGAAAFVAQKLLRDPFNKLVSYQYDIGGTWDDPQELKSSAENISRPAASMPGR